MRYSEAKKRLLVLWAMRWERSHLFGGKAFKKEWSRGRYGYFHHILVSEIFNMSYIDFIHFLDQVEDKAYKDLKERGA
jgi:hypothetical protein